MARELPRLEQRNLISIPGRVAPRTRAVAPVPDIGDPGATGRAIGQLGSVVGQVADSYIKKAVIKEYNSGYRSLLDAKSDATDAARANGDDPTVFRQQMNEWFNANKDKYTPGTWGRLNKTHADLSFQGTSSFARIAEAKDEASIMASFKGAVAELEGAKVDAIRNNQPEVAADLQRDIDGYYLTAAATDTIDVAIADNAIRESREGAEIELGKNQVDQMFGSQGADAAQLLIDGGEGLFADPDVRLKSQSLLDTRKTEKRKSESNARLDLSLKQNESAALIGRKVLNGELTEAQLDVAINATDEAGNPVVSTTGGNNLRIRFNKETTRRRAITDRIRREQAAKNKAITKIKTDKLQRLYDVAFLQYESDFNNPTNPTPTREKMLLAARGQSISKQAAMEAEWFAHYGIAAKEQLEREAYADARSTGIHSPSAEPERSRRNTEIIDSDRPVNEKLALLVVDAGSLGVISKELPKFGQSLINRTISAAVQDETMGGTFAVFMAMKQKFPAVYDQLPRSITDEVDYHQSQTQGSQLGAIEAIEGRRKFLKRPVEEQRILETLAGNTDGHEEFLEENFDGFVDLPIGLARASILAEFSADYGQRTRNGENQESALSNANIRREQVWNKDFDGNLMKHSPFAFNNKWFPTVPDDAPERQFEREYLDQQDFAVSQKFPMPPIDIVGIAATSATKKQFNGKTNPQYIVVLKEPWEGHDAGSAVHLPDNIPYLWTLEYEGTPEQAQDQAAAFEVAQAQEALRQERLHRRALERSVIEGRSDFKETEAAKRVDEEAVRSRRATAKQIKKRRGFRREFPRQAERLRKLRIAETGTGGEE